MVFDQSMYASNYEKVASAIGVYLLKLKKIMCSIIGKPYQNADEYSRLFMYQYSIQGVSNIRLYMVIFFLRRATAL